MGHNLTTNEFIVSFGTVGADNFLGHSWGRVKVKVRFKVRN